MFEIRYNNTLDEIKKGFSRFQVKYLMRRLVLFSIVYAIGFLLGLDLFVKSPSGYYGPVVMALALGLLASQWLKPYFVRKKLMETLEGLHEEKYKAQFFDDRIVIETEFVEAGVQADENETGTERTNPEPSVINLVGNLLFSYEDKEMFLLFVNRSLIYIFPKRCLESIQEESLRKYFNDKEI